MFENVQPIKTTIRASNAHANAYADLEQQWQSVVNGLEQAKLGVNNYCETVPQTLRNRWLSFEQNWYAWDTVDVLNWIRYKMGWYHDTSQNLKS